MDKIYINGMYLYEINILDILPGKYYISKQGDVYTKFYNKFLAHNIDKDKYHKVLMQSKNGKRKSYKVARLVLYMFKGAPPKNMIDPTTEHIDGNRENNNINNLKWMSRSENSRTRKNIVLPQMTIRRGA